MNLMRWFAYVALCVATLTQAIAATPVSAAQSAAMTPLVSAGPGWWKSILSVPQPGFYSVRVHGGQAIRIRLRGRMSGPGEWRSIEDGEPAARLDTLLDAGEYVLDVHAPEGARSGELRARVVRATEQNDETQVWPGPTADVSTTLADGELRSYWLTLTSTRVVNLQAAGRALADLRVFRDGVWVMSDRRQRDLRTPDAGAPMTILSTTLVLPPGRYRIRAVGARPHTWTQAVDRFPLYLRTGFERLMANQRALRAVSPFGTDHYLMPQGANLARAEFALPTNASLRVQSYAEHWPFKQAGELRELDKKQRIPVLEIRPRGRPGFSPAEDLRFDLVTVRGKPGTSYVLQTARVARRQSVTTPGFYRVQALPIGAARDQAPVTGLAFSGRRGQQRHGLAASGAVQLTPGSRFERQFNLERETEIFVRVVADGRYRFAGSGSQASYAIKPYGRPSKGKWREQTPDDDGVLDLTRGYYRLYVRPELPGVHRMTIGGAASATTERRLLPTAVGYDALEVKPKHEAIISNADAADAVGLSIRKLPIELARPLPLVLDPGETAQVPVSVTAAGVVRFEAADGQPGTTLAIVDEAGKTGAETESLSLAPGVTLVSVRSTRLAPITGLLTFSAREVPASADEQTRQTGRLEPGTPVEVRFADGLARRFALSVPESGYFGFRSSGVLALRAALHTRARAGLSAAPSAAPSASGRNFAWHGWLGAGDYHLDVTPEGSSRGSATLIFESVAPAHGGAVDAERGASAWVGKTRGTTPLWQFQMDVPVSGRYRVRAMEGDRRHPFVLIDASGWPVTRPFATGDAVLELGAGAYDVVVAPARRAERLVVELVAIGDETVREGHGPHALMLPADVKHRWADDGPDQWTFVLDAPGTVVIGLTADMRGSLRRRGSDVQVGPQSPFESWTGELPAGTYVMDVSHPRQANRTDYALRIATRELLPGQRREVTLPARLQLVVPASGELDVRSSGPADTRASLHREVGMTDAGEATGLEVARVDDDGADWNFALRGKFVPGRYYLKLRGPPGQSRETTVAMYRASGDANVPSAEEATSPRPVALGAGGVVDVQITPGTTRKVQVPGGLGLVLASSRIAPVRLVSGELVAATVATGAALAYESTPAMVELSGEARQPDTVRLRHQPLAPGPALVLTGEQVGVDAGEARRVTLQGNQANESGRTLRRVAFELPPHVYVLVAGHTLGGPSAGRWSVDTRADEFLLANVSDVASQVGVEHIEMPSRATRQLYARGQGRWRPLLPGPVRAAGSVTKLDRVAGEIVHGAGLAVAWSDTAGFWAGRAEQDADTSAAVPFEADDGGMTVSLAVSAPRVLTLRASSPALARLETGGDARHMLLDGGDNHFVVPEGKVRLGLRALTGVASVALLSHPAARLDEGLSAPRVLASRGLALYYFELGREQPVGIGLQTDASTLHLKLLDARGATLAQTVNLTRRLPAGRYLLQVENHGKTAATARIALVGTAALNVPPDDVIQSYLRRALAQGVKP